MEGVEENAREGLITAGQEGTVGGKLKRWVRELAHVRSVRRRSVSFESHTDL